jgi:hypothetical protein
MPELSEDNVYNKRTPVHLGDKTPAAGRQLLECDVVRWDRQTRPPNLCTREALASPLRRVPARWYDKHVPTWSPWTRHLE